MYYFKIAIERVYHYVVEFWLVVVEIVTFWLLIVQFRIISVQLQYNQAKK